MKLRKKSIVVILFIGFILSGSFIFSSIKADTIINDCASNIKDQLKTNNKGSIVLKGKNITITEEEIELKEKAYELKNDTNPENAAIQHLLERKVLLNKAIEMGFKATEEEVDQQISSVKEAVKDAENYNDYIDFMNQYDGGEDAYWQDIRETTKETLIINKYLNCEKEKYEQTNKNSVSIASAENSETNLLQGWNDQKDKIVKALIDKEYITVIDKQYKDCSIFDQYKNIQE